MCQVPFCLCGLSPFILPPSFGTITLLSGLYGYRKLDPEWLTPLLKAAPLAGGRVASTPTFQPLLHLPFPRNLSQRVASPHPPSHEDDELERMSSRCFKSPLEAEEGRPGLHSGQAPHSQSRSASQDMWQPVAWSTLPLPRQDWTLMESFPGPEPWQSKSKQWPWSLDPRGKTPLCTLPGHPRQILHHPF